jgi:hypothetical protein
MAEEEVREEEEEFDFEEWLSQGIRAMRRMKGGKLHKRHAEYRTHMRSAGKEMLVAFRSLLDEAIEQFEREPGKEDKPGAEAKTK